MSVLERRGRRDIIPRALALVRDSCEIVPPGEQTFESAGRIHARERSHHRDFSLADALVLALAKERSASILTTDRALAKNQQGVIVRVV